MPSSSAVLMCALRSPAVGGDGENVCRGGEHLLEGGHEWGWSFLWVVVGGC